MVAPVKALFVFGTRPEAIKLAPVIRQLQLQPDKFIVRCCSTGQHRELLRQVLDVFSITPDYDLAVMEPGQTLSQSTARILSALEGILVSEAPGVVLVQGDTTTTLCGALAGFYARTCVAHVEAGLRTYDMQQPFPEEMNRVVASRLATLHFAVTEESAKALAAEGVERGVSITGNTGIDALLDVRDRLHNGQLSSSFHLPIDPTRRLIVVTAHRRESFGPGIENICTAVAALAARENVQIVLPVHPNPSVKQIVHERIGNLPNIFLTDPLDYVSFIDLMRRSYLILTDSGGVQEEAPSLGKPVLVLRDKTERMEAVAAGTTRLVGTDPTKIVDEVTYLIHNQAEYERRACAYNPYGDGQASKRIAALLTSFFD